MLFRFNKKHLYLLVFIVAVSIFAVSLYHRVPDEDESVIAGHSYFFNKLGYVKSDLYGGYLEGGNAWEIRQYAYHKLFVLTGALFMNIFGFHIFGFKLISLVFSILFLAILYRYLKKFTPDFSVPFYLLTCSLLFFNYFFFDSSFKFRPEIMVMSLGFLSFYFLESGFSNKTRYYFMLSGMFAGLAAFTHLNGLIFSFAGILLIVLKKDFRNFLLFGIPGGAFSLLYLFDIHSFKEAEALLHQFRTDPNVFDKVPLYVGLLNEHMRFFHSPKEIVLTLVFLFSLIFNFKFLRKNLPDLLLYLLFLVIGLAILAHGKSSKYLLNYLPFMSIIIALGYREILKQKNSIKLTGSILMMAFILVHGFYNIQIIRSRIDISEHNKMIAGFIKDKNAKISSPSVFVFNEITNFSSIRGEIAWDHHYYAFHPNEVKSLENYFSFAQQNGDNYIVIDKTTKSREEILDIFNLPVQVNDSLYGFKVIERSPALIILKRI